MLFARAREKCHSTRKTRLYFLYLPSRRSTRTRVARRATSPVKPSRHFPPASECNDDRLNISGDTRFLRPTRNYMFRLRGSRPAAYASIIRPERSRDVKNQYWLNSDRASTLGPSRDTNKDSTTRHGTLNYGTLDFRSSLQHRLKSIPRWRR